VPVRRACRSGRRGLRRRRPRGAPTAVAAEARASRAGLTEGCHSVQVWLECLVCRADELTTRPYERRHWRTAMAIIVLTRVTRYGTPDPRAPVSTRLGADDVIVERADKGLDLGAGEERRRHPLHVVEAGRLKHAAHRTERAEGSRGKRLHVCDGRGLNRLGGACRRVSGREEVRRALLGM
jgi:hypothetical protein